jgi:hypothetical protein
MITIQKVTINAQSVPRQSPDIYWHAEMCSRYLLSLILTTLSWVKEKHFIKVKVKQSHYSPWQALRVPGGWGSKISRQSAHEGCKVVRLTRRPSLPPENIPGTHFCLTLSRPQGYSAAVRIMSMKKNPITPSGIDPATFWFVAQCLNHCATACPDVVMGSDWNCLKYFWVCFVL